jgi:hypothetical protein
MAFDQVEISAKAVRNDVNIQNKNESSSVRHLDLVPRSYHRCLYL